MRIVPEIYIDGIELSKLPITQNEKGEYYALKDKKGNIVDYIRPTIAEFDTYVIPRALYKKGYRKYFDGSHTNTNYHGVNVRAQKPVDVSRVGRVTSNVEWLMEYATLTQGGVCRISSGTKLGFWKRYTLYPTHTYKFTKTSTVVKPGKTICYVDPDYKHMHFWWKWFGLARKARDFMLLK